MPRERTRQQTRMKSGELAEELAGTAEAAVAAVETAAALLETPAA